MKAVIVRRNMKFEYNLFVFQLFLCVSLLTTIECVGTGDKLVHFKLV